MHGRDLGDTVMAATDIETLQRLRRYWDLGSKVVAGSKKLESKDARKVTMLVAEETGERYPEVNRAKLFAELFPKNDFAKLCNLRRKDGKLIGWGHVTAVLRVRDKQQRWKLLRQAARENMTVRKLEELAKGQATDKRDRGGGLFKMASTVADSRDDIQKRCIEWLRWHDQLEEPYEGEIGLEDLPPELCKNLEQVQRAVERLQAASAVKRSPRKKQ